MMNKQFYIKLDEELYDIIRRIAIKSHRSFSAQVKYMVYEQLKIIGGDEYEKYLNKYEIRIDCNGREVVLPKEYINIPK